MEKRNGEITVVLVYHVEKYFGFLVSSWSICNTSKIKFLLIKNDTLRKAKQIIKTKTKNTAASSASSLVCAKQKRQQRDEMRNG